MSAFGTSIRELLRPLRCSVVDEAALQDLIADSFTSEGVSFEREVRLSAHDRIDFLCDTVGIEVKVDGSVSDVTRQLHRYAQSERVAEIILVTTRSRHTAVPASFAGKPIRVLHLMGGAF